MLGLSFGLCCGGGRPACVTAGVLLAALGYRSLVGGSTGGCYKALVQRRSQSNTSEIPEQYQCEAFVECCSATTSKMQQISSGIDTSPLKTARLITQVIILL
jgi:hypothetical protein